MIRTAILLRRGGKADGKEIGRRLASGQGPFRRRSISAKLAVTGDFNCVARRLVLPAGGASLLMGASTLRHFAGLSRLWIRDDSVPTGVRV